MPAPDRQTLDLDAVLASRTPNFTIGGITFDGRPVGWPVVLTFDTKPPEERVDIILTALRNRASDPDLITPDWVDEHLTVPMIQLVVGILFQGERPAMPARGKGKA